VSCTVEAFRPTNGLVLHHQLAHLVHPTIVVTTSIQQLLTIYLVSTTSAQHQLHNDVPHTTSNALFAVHDPAVVSELLRRTCLLPIRATAKTLTKGADRVKEEDV
jgi:hypothetical protein